VLSSRSLLRAVVGWRRLAWAQRPSHAGVITYTDYSSWMAAISGPTTVTIPDPGLGNSSIGRLLRIWQRVRHVLRRGLFDQRYMSDGNFLMSPPL